MPYIFIDINTAIKAINNQQTLKLMILEKVSKKRASNFLKIWRSLGLVPRPGGAQEWPIQDGPYPGLSYYGTVKAG